MALAANDSEVLVIATEKTENAGDEEASTSQIVVWLVDTAERRSTRTPLLQTAPVQSDLLVEWFNDRWIMMRTTKVDWDTRCSVWISPDGMSWTEQPLPERLAQWCGSSLTTGPSGVIVTRSSLDGDDIWYSPDGSVWELVYDRSAVAKSTYSETLGYVVEVTTEDATLASTDGDAIMVSSDGKTWHLAGPARSDYGMSFFLAASDGNLLVRDDAFNLWLWTNSP
jgi:hypothetical protein